MEPKKKSYNQKMKALTAKDHLEYILRIFDDFIISKDSPIDIDDFQSFPPLKEAGAQIIINEIEHLIERCDRLDRFYVDTSNEYGRHRIVDRETERSYLPPKDEWGDEKSIQEICNLLNKGNKS